MAQEIINIGNVANDGNGDPLRLAFEKINNNFTQLYSIAGGSGAAAGVDGSVQFRATNDLLSVAYSNGTWVAFGAPDKFYVSYDGVIWTNTPAPVSQQIRAVYATPVGFIAVGDGGTIITSNDVGVTWSVETTVTFGLLDLKDIEYYVDTNDPMDKAGSYGIQGLASTFIESINGCYYNVMGLPVSSVAKELSKICVLMKEKELQSQ